MLTNIFVLIISTYLSAVTILADVISIPFEYLSPETTEVEVPESPTETDGKPSEAATTTEVTEGRNETSAKSIPQVLIENASYQSAAVVESIAPQDATSTAYDALVNVFCEHINGNQTQFTTGTGFFVDTSGVIITNAHVAHYLLMDGIIGETTCTIRTGNPAAVAYTADLLYISPSWIRENAAMFTSQSPKGTGERDYALLYITGSATTQPLPQSFPALPFATELLRTSMTDETVYAAGYPANALIASHGRSDLVPKLATTSIAELMTFGSNYADIFTIYGSSVGEQGASGGPVLTTNGDVIGIISTKGDSTRFGEGALRAITMSYIDRTISEETGYSFLENISGDVPYRAQIFNDVMVPFLKLLLEQER